MMLRLPITDCRGLSTQSYKFFSFPSVCRLSGDRAGYPASRAKLRAMIIILIVLIVLIGGGGYYAGPGWGYYGGGGLELILIIVLIYLLFGRRRTL